jgi:hypothetical protein
VVEDLDRAQQVERLAVLDREREYVACPWHGHMFP